MQNNKISKFAFSTIALSVIALAILLVPMTAFAKRAVPGAPPPGRAWVWVDPHWELVDAPPGPAEWRAGYWDSKRHNWVDGAWVSIKPKRKDYVWVDGRFDPGKRVWISGHWGRPGKGGITISIGTPRGRAVPAPPPGGRTWVWVEGHWDLVSTPPQGPAEWRAGYWDTRLNIWVPGAWITIGAPAPAGRVWITPYWDTRSRAWITGHWGNPAPNVVAPKPGPPVVAPGPRTSDPKVVPGHKPGTPDGPDTPKTGKPGPSGAGDKGQLNKGKGAPTDMNKNAAPNTKNKKGKGGPPIPGE